MSDIKGVEDALEALQGEAASVDFNQLIAGRFSSEPPSYVHEWELLSHVIRSSQDIVDLDIKRISRRRDDGDNRTVLDEKSFKFVTVNFDRNDIPDFKADQRLGEAARHRYAFKWVDENKPYVYTGINHDAGDEYLYDRKHWIELRKKALVEALKQKPNVVSFGEFDFPPVEETEDCTEYERAISDFTLFVQKEIDACDHPVVLFAGSRHELEYGASRSKSPPLLGCVNKGFLYFNEKTRINKSLGEVSVFKRSPALKAGESLSGRAGNTFEGYETILGRVAVLICSDAYDPNILFEMFLNSKHRGIQRIEFFLVPSYNTSPKLEQSCQVLSYFTDSVVLYCNAAKDRDNRVTSQLYFCGLPLSSWKNESLSASVLRSMGKQSSPNIDKANHRGFSTTTYDLPVEFWMGVKSYCDTHRSTYSKQLVEEAENKIVKRQRKS